MDPLIKTFYITAIAFFCVNIFKFFYLLGVGLLHGYKVGRDLAIQENEENGHPH